MYFTKIPFDHVILEDRQSFAANVYVIFTYTKTKGITLTSHKGHRQSSEFFSKVNECTWRETGENERVKISLILPLIACIKSGFSFYWKVIE